VAPVWREEVRDSSTELPCLIYIPILFVAMQKRPALVCIGRREKAWRNMIA
jgi:hypothetical protein